jgi:hypothetical protein
VGHTVVHERGVPARSVAIIDLASGVRTVAVDADPDRAAATVADDRVGEVIEVRSPGVFAP